VLAGTDLVDLRREARRGTKIRTSVHDDLVDRRFCARAADEIWLTDITEHHTDESKPTSRLYLCAITDVYRGSHVRSRQFVHKLSHNGFRGSMGRVGACGDNAAMKSFSALLQRTVLDRQPRATRTEQGLAIVTWIERNHRRRRQRALVRLTPMPFELLHTPVATEA
jgi:putative transposase